MLSIVKSVDDPVHRERIVNRIQSKDNGDRQGSCEQDTIEQKHLIGSFLINALSPLPAQESEKGYTCECPRGFEGADCDHKKLTCADAPCFHEGKCRETENGHAYMCECPAGYTGLNCERKVDKCTMLQCTNGDYFFFVTSPYFRTRFLFL